MNGAISQGFLPTVVLHLGRRRARALLVTRHERDIGLFHFVDGALSSAQLGPLVGAAALRAVALWTEGEYAVYERLPASFSASAFVSAHDDQTSALLMRWLREDGFFPQLAPWPEVAIHVVQYVQPALIVTSCPKAEAAPACENMRAMLKRVCNTTPVVVLIKDGTCDPSETPCLSKPVDRDTFEDLLEDHLLPVQRGDPEEVTWRSASPAA